ncbi:MAG TPA: hypothetical protein VKR55_32350 [Bradyrhizobium sp.]|uniref:hypothetical protein n=1 Tax=Bradyrhizobium sp. TaxID=376 RepID=UPI002BB7B5BB|nr:hypothetical protein [Bradyrhizobium sp.]HLZ06825.1 hypothetical protein [Bradyrhizobium sp.]
MKRPDGQRLDERLGQPFVTKNRPGHRERPARLGRPVYGLAAPVKDAFRRHRAFNKEVNAAFADAAMKAGFAAMSGEPSPGTLAQFGSLIAEETEKWAKVVKFAGFKIE